jgi:hypothetical protein
MSLQELQISALWAGKQSAKATANTAPAHRFKQIGGGFAAPGELASQPYSDATQFGDDQDWLNTLVGNGSPVILATPDELAWLFYAMEGGETTAPVTGPPAKTKHTAVALPGLGHWLTWVTRQGSAVIDRLQWNDVQIGQLQVEGGTASKAVRATPTLISLDPAEQRAADPSQAMPADASFLYTDGTARFKIDGTAFRGHSAFTLVINKDLQPVYSDAETVYDLALGNVGVTVTVTNWFDADGHAQFNKLVYGTATPAAGAKPLRGLPALGSYGFDLRARDAAGAANGDKFVLTIAGVRWQIPDAPDPNPEGGAAEITLTGLVRKSGSNPHYQVDIDTDAGAFSD